MRAKFLLLIKRRKSDDAGRTERAEQSRLKDTLNGELNSELSGINSVAQ